MKQETKDTLKAALVLLMVIIVTGLGNHYIDGIY